MENTVFGMLIVCYFGILVFWHFGILAFWYFGILTFGILALLHFGILAFWHLVCWHVCILVFLTFEHSGILTFGHSHIQTFANCDIRQDGVVSRLLSAERLRRAGVRQHRTQARRRRRQLFDLSSWTLFFLLTFPIIFVNIFVINFL